VLAVVGTLIVERIQSELAKYGFYEFQNDPRRIPSGAVIAQQSGRYRLASQRVLAIK
jgi:hypothetical protein